MEVNLAYQNMGREPALNFSYDTDMFTAITGEEQNAVKSTVEYLAKCKLGTLGMIINWLAATVASIS